MLKKITANKSFLVISAIYLLTFVCMLPLRNQTYQDDWAYVQSVRHFLQTGNIQVSEWSSASLIFPIYWGGIFSRIFGASITSLHLSTIVLLYFGTIAFFSLLQELNVSKIRSIFFTIVLFSFPWVFDFSYTFLTDVPFMSLTIISILFYTKALKSNSSRLFVLGSLFAGFAFLTRQIAIALPIAMFITLIFSSFIAKKIRFKTFLLTTLPFLVMGGIYLKWLNTGQNMTNAQFILNQIFFKNVAPYLTPFNLQKVGTTYAYYLTYVQRGLLYFHLSIGFLLPVFIIFKPNFKSISSFLSKNKFYVLSISIVYAILLSFEIWQHYARKTFILEIPNLITRYNQVALLDFNILWKYFIGLSVIIWIPLLAKLLKSILKNFFEPLKKKHYVLFIIFSLANLAFLSIYEFALLNDEYVHTHATNPYLDIVSKISIYLNNTQFNEGRIIVQNSLIILFALGLLFFIVSFLVSFYQIKIKNNHFKPEFVFLLLSFLGIFSILVVYMYFYWHQYIIALIPFFIIFLALVTRHFKINNVRLLAVSVFLILFSLFLTKHRYEKPGIVWEISNNLVQMGIKPINIGGGDESWVPWWYFEQTREEAVKTQFDGNKYLISPGQWGTWRTVKPDTTCNYDIIEKSSPNYLPGSDSKILLEKTFYVNLLQKSKFVVIESKCDSKKPQT